MRVWVNGCFDILHVGHIALLKHAKNLHGRDNTLIVGVDTDARVKASKGESRPINTVEDRVIMLGQLKMVDKIVVFGSDTELISELIDNQVDVIVVGEEYRGRVVGSEHVGLVEYFKRIGDYSTTNIIERK